MKVLLAICALLCASAASAQVVLYVDLGDAYTRSDALAGLLRQVDEELGRIRDEYQPREQALRADLAALRTSRMSEEAKQTRRVEIARELQKLAQAREAAQELLAQANARAIAQVDAALRSIKEQVRAEARAVALLDAQETLYLRRGGSFDRTDEVYRRLNEQLPEVVLRVHRRPAAAS